MHSPGERGTEHHHQGMRMALSRANQAPSFRRPRWLLLFLACVLACVLVLWPAVAGSQPASPRPAGSDAKTNQPNQVLAEVREILKDEYQSELPTLLSQLDPSSNQADSSEAQARPMSLPDVFSKMLLVLGIILVLVVAINTFYRDGGKFDDEQETDGEAGMVNFGTLALPDPDALAAQGRYAEAIHALLLRSLALVSHRLDLTWPRSLTSREILRHQELTDEARAGLRQLIRRVEIHHFGGMVPVEADFQHSREIFTRLAGSRQKERP
ncbi:hypothetical protein CSB20_04600 [bacterium DOLZORAL124_64_63]|nr:MAG: hypothetical protein CSB20_04600 [bacterium DOLZORAL124_64_63]